MVNNNYSILQSEHAYRVREGKAALLMALTYAPYFHVKHMHL